MADSPTKDYVLKSRNFSAYTVETKSGKEYFVEGYVTNDVLDLDNDIISKSCIADLKSQRDNVADPLDLDHSTLRGDKYDITQKALGKSVDMKLDAGGLFVKYKLNPRFKQLNKSGQVLQTFEDVWQDVQDEFLKGFSIAFKIIKSTLVDNKNDGIPARIIQKARWINTALTGNPVNPAAQMTGFREAATAKSKASKSGELAAVEDFDEIIVKSMLGKNKDSNHSDVLKSFQETADRLSQSIESIEKSLLQITKKGENMSSEEKDKQIANQKSEDGEGQAPAPSGEGSSQPAAPAEGGQAPAAPTDAPAAPATEQKSIDAELKSQIASMGKQMETMAKSIADIQEALNKPIHKSLGAENKEHVQQKSEGITNPLDLIR